MRQPTVHEIVAALRLLPRRRPRRTATGEKLLTVSSTWNARSRSRRDQMLPMIRMRGRWLQQLGFRTGARIVVTTERNRIVLTLARGEE